MNTESDFLYAPAVSNGVLSKRELDRRAKRDAQRHMAADIPCPRDFAQWLEVQYVEMLFSAQRRDTWYVSESIARQLRPLGLCGYGTTGLTAFGIKVLRELRAMDA